MAGRECPQCREPLMGAVNRCWKCGLDLRAETTPAANPRSVTIHEPLIVAEVVEEKTAVEAEASPLVPPPVVAQPQQPPPATEDGYLEFGPNGSPIRRGSPFAPGAMLLPPRTLPEFQGSDAKKKTTLQQSYASSGGAIAALVLGIFGLMLAPLRFEGAIVGLVGLVMGIWGLYSNRRGWALAGLILCCLAIGVGMYTGVFWLFRVINNANPWEY